VLKTDPPHLGQLRLISSLKNSTAFEQLGHWTSKMASKPHSCQLLPVHFRMIDSAYGLKQVLIYNRWIKYM
jgi:hypothetical protein